MFRRCRPTTWPGCIPRARSSSLPSPRPSAARPGRPCGRWSAAARQAPAVSCPGRSSALITSRPRAWKAWSRSPAARPRPCARWPRRPPMWSAPSWASTPPAGQRRRSWRRTRLTTPNGVGVMTATEERVSSPQTAGTPQTRGFRITRRRPDGARSRVDQFEVTVGPDTTLLDALREIRSHHDRSLTLRYSCCHASCGTCGMRANGREVLACVTPLASLGAGPITVEPLANARVEHDLVVDMRDLYAGLEPARRPLIRQDERLADRDQPGSGFARYED